MIRSLVVRLLPRVRGDLVLVRGLGQALTRSRAVTMPSGRGPAACIGRRRRRTLRVKRFLGYPTSPGPIDGTRDAQIGPSSARATGTPGIRIDG
jgi:hypothetical protein